MNWKIVHNPACFSHDVPYRDHCHRFGETATLTIHIDGTQLSKYDLQPTFSPKNFKCNLLEGRNEKDTCALDCPLFKKYLNSHSF